MIIDKIRFEIIKNSEGQNSETLIYINEKNLIEMLKEYEMPLAVNEGHPDIAGGYMGMFQKELHDELVNEKEEIKTILACGGCGETGCWPMYVMVKREEEEIVWKDFRQVYRKEWNYSTFPDFRFNFKQYQNEINKLVN